MARKCDTAKYKKRKHREHLNKGERIRRISLERSQMYEQIRRQKYEAELRRLADPRTQLGQQLVNVLYARLSSAPLYKIMQIGEIFGVRFQDYISDIIEREEAE